MKEQERLKIIDYEQFAHDSKKTYHQILWFSFGVLALTSFLSWWTYLSREYLAVLMFWPITWIGIHSARKTYLRNKKRLFQIVVESVMGD